MDSFGLYVHFPYCVVRCSYCDFNTYVADVIPRVAYTDAVLAEGATRSPAYAHGRLTSIYFGGGTPSLWGADQVARVLGGAETWFPRRAERVEVTLECNPGEADPVTLAAYRAAGVNRLSLGVQSLDDALLAPLLRRHSAAQARGAVDHALAAGFDSVSADLIFGLPGQTVQGFVADLQQLVCAGVPHLSHYHLTLEAGTQITREVRAGRIRVPPDDAAADMFEAIAPTLAPFGLAPYEISSSAQAGHWSRHNTTYWQGRPYLGLGAGAHSFLPPAVWTREAVCVRSSSRRHHAAYVQEVSAAGSAPVFEERLDRLTHLRERMFTGLRHLPGLSLSALNDELGLDPRQVFEAELQQLVEGGLLHRAEDHVALTTRGLRVADSVFGEFF